MALEPTWPELLNEFVDSRLLDVHTAIPARVIEFHDDESTVDALPVVKARVPSVDGGTKAEAIPTIYDVPVAWPGSGSVFMKWPIPKGSHVLLIFQESCIAQWRDTGEVSEPGDLARHDWSYPYALPIRGPHFSGRSGPSEEPGAVGDDLVIEAPGLKLGSGASDFAALAGLVMDRLNAIQQAYDTHTHADPASGSTGTPSAVIGALDPVAASKTKVE